MQNPFVVHLLIYLVSFVGIWIGSGFVIKSIEVLSRKIKVSSFAISFLVLGFFTSIGELSVGVNSVMERDPEIYVGNLIGASVVIFLLVIPLLAILGNSIHISSEFRGFNLAASLIVVAIPAVSVMDGSVSMSDGIISLILFGFLLFSIQMKKGLIERIEDFNKDFALRLKNELLKIIFGVVVVFAASHFIVQETLYFASALSVSPFLISLLMVSIGTNIPELSLVVRSMFVRNHQVAFGDYVGSACFNTFLFGFLTKIYNQRFYLSNSYVVSLLFLIVGLVAFYFFAKSKNTISRLEGLFLIILYILFIFTEVYLHESLMFWNKM
ncbi:MAG: hypothetical protein KatS3mg088_535 [Patescibacteria group bacterium]|nr:MAG: hypothetical protein KatS3mg088_535 [Patescibacteria group bacterium]